MSDPTTRALMLAERIDAMLRMDPKVQWPVYDLQWLADAARELRLTDE